MAEILEFKTGTQRETPRKILEDSIARNLETAVVIGWTDDGHLYFGSSTADGGDVLWLIEIVKKHLLDVC